MRVAPSLLPEPLGHLGVGEADDAREQDHLAVLLRQRRERLLGPRPVLAAGGLPARRRPARDAREQRPLAQRRDLSRIAPLARVVAALVGDLALGGEVEPLPEVGLVELAPGLQVGQHLAAGREREVERLLARPEARAGPGPDERDEPPEVLLDERVEGPPIPARRPAHQGGVELLHGPASLPGGLDSPESP